MHDHHILPRHWNPKKEADAVMSRLVTVTAPQVKGAHDAEMVLVGGHAYIVAEVNDLRAGESASWPEIYCTLSVVNLQAMVPEAVIPMARTGQEFANATLPEGQCFVPRILRKDAGTLRCYFASQDPGRREAQTWFIDFDLASRAFDNRIFKARLKTGAGIVDMQPRHFHADAVAHGFRKPAVDHGLYLFDSFKVFDGRPHVAINNFPGRQNALAMVNAELDTFEIIGHYNEPQNLQFSESAVNRLPDGTWMAICRQESGNSNYVFTTSRNGKDWTPGRPIDAVPNGANSKPTFDCFNGVYYLGWQEATRIGTVARSIFNLDVSRDGRAWERKYRFETDRSFQYPTFREHDGSVYLTVTEGDPGVGGKVRIRFGRLCNATPPL